jgi:hypothetical protein
MPTKLRQKAVSSKPNAAAKRRSTRREIARRAYEIFV